MFAGGRCLPKTMEDADVFSKAVSDLRAYSPDAVPFLAVLETTESFCASLREGGS